MAEEVYEGRVGDLVRVDVSSGQDTSPASKYVTLGPGDNTFDIKKSDLKWKPIDFFVTRGFSSQDSLVYSGFSTTNYIVMGDVICPFTKKWTLNMKVTTGTDVSTNSRVISIAGFRDIKVPVLGLTGGQWKLWLTSNGSSWDIANGVLGSSTVATSTTYWLKLAYDGSSYTLKESTNGSTFTTVIEVASSTPIYIGSGATCIGATKYDSSSTAQQLWLGSIDLSGWSYVEDDGYKVTFDRQVRYEDATSYLSSVVGSSDYFSDTYFNAANLYLYGYYKSFNTLYKVNDIELSVTGVDGDSSSDKSYGILTYCSLDKVNMLPKFIYYLLDLTGKSAAASGAYPVGVYNIKVLAGIDIQDAIKEGATNSGGSVVQLTGASWVYSSSIWATFFRYVYYYGKNNKVSTGSTGLMNSNIGYTVNNAGPKFSGVVGCKSTYLEDGDASVITGAVYILSAYKSVSEQKSSSNTTYTINF